jgi:hypothetical protein
MESNEKLQEKAADVALENGIPFTIHGLGEFNIKPLNLHTLISISKDALKVRKIEKASTLSVIAESGKAWAVCRVVSAAILRKWWKRKLFKNMFAFILMLYIKDAEELYNLELAVINLSKADFFLNCINLTSSIRPMAPRNTQETKAPGESSPE